MPLIVQNKHTNHNTTLALWRADESTEELAAIAGADGRNIRFVHSFSLEKRKREWLTARILLNLLVDQGEIYTISNGKPFLKNGPQISISHCENIAGVIVSDQSVGIDIQNPVEKLAHIARRFCSEGEMQEAMKSKDSLTYFTMIWSAKEAVFKFFGEHVRFANDMRVEAFSAEDKTMRIHYSGEHGARIFDLRHDFIDNFHIIHTE